MSVKTTRRSILNSTNINLIKSASYCSLYYLLKYHEPVAYVSSICGWDYDVYVVNNLTICTGYRRMPGERLKKVSDYETKARKICLSNINDITKKNHIEKLLKEFCELNSKNE